MSNITTLQYLLTINLSSTNLIRYQQSWRGYFISPLKTIYKIEYMRGRLLISRELKLVTDILDQLTTYKQKRCHLPSAISDADYWTLPYYKEVADAKANHHPTISLQIYLTGKIDRPMHQEPRKHISFQEKKENMELLKLRNDANKPVEARKTPCVVNYSTEKIPHIAPEERRTWNLWTRGLVPTSGK